MARFGRSFQPLLLSTFFILATVKSASAKRGAQARPYIEASCAATRYQALCVQSLSGFQNSTLQTPKQLAQAALAVSLYRAGYTRSYMVNVAQDLEAAKDRDYQAVKDCIYQITDGVELLGQSIKELRRMEGLTPAAIGKNDVFWHVNNVEDWISAALTDAATCADGFPAGIKMSKLKATIKCKVINVAQTTSNALALFHRYAARYGSSASTNSPRDLKSGDVNVTPKP